MSTDRETARIVQSWLTEGVMALPDRVLDAVLDQVPATPQRRSAWPSRRLALMNRVGASLAAAAVVVVAVGIVGMNLSPGGAGPGPSGSAGTAPSTPPATVPAGARQHEVVDGIRFSVETRGWEAFGPNGLQPGIAWVSLNRSYHGPQDAEALIYWTSPFDGLYTDRCQKTLGVSGDVSAVDLATAVAGAPGTGLVSGPEDVFVGGQPAKFLVVTVRDAIGCNPGFFFSWDQYHGGALWAGSTPGDTIRVWIVDVDGRNLFIAAETHPGAEAQADGDVRGIVESIEFE